MAGLKRALGLFDTAAMAVGAIIGAGIFVLTGITSQLAGPALVLSIILAGVVALLTAVSINRLVREFPSEGGEYEYGYKTFSPLVGFSSGWMWTLNKIVAGSVLALGFATYFSLFLPAVPIKLIAFGVIALVTLINYSGIRSAGTAIDLLVVAKVAILLVFVVVGLPAVKAQNFVPFAPGGIAGVVQAAAIIFFAYVGFARPVYLVEEIKDPKKNVPRGIYAALALSSLLYLAVSIVAIGLVGSKALGNSDSPLAAAIASSGAAWAPQLIALGALIATFSVLLDDNLGLSRMIFAMGRRGDYPKWLGQVNSNGVPAKSVAFSGLLAAFLTLSFDLRGLAATSSFFILVYFALVNLSALKRSIGQKISKALTPMLGIIGTLGLVLALPASSIVAGLLLTLAGVVYFKAKR